MSELVNTLVSEFLDKEYAHAYMESFNSMEIAGQIIILREQRGITQRDLSEKIGREITELEDPDFEDWDLKTLQKLAYEFDVSVKVSFEKFSDRIQDVPNLVKEKLERTERTKDLNEFKNNVLHSYSKKNFGEVRKKNELCNEMKIITVFIGSPSVWKTDSYSYGLKDSKMHTPLQVARYAQ